MAPMKFGLFKARGRDQHEQPSTENLLQSSCHDAAGSPVASTSAGARPAAASPGASLLALDSDDDLPGEEHAAARRGSDDSLADAQVNYELLRSQASPGSSSSSTLHEELERLECDEPEGRPPEPDATSYDADSSELDVTSITASDLSIYCASLKKPKKSKSKEEQQLRDLDMWQASNLEVMQNLLERSGTLDEQIKWEAIASARGLCALTDGCACSDCVEGGRAARGAALGDGDGGLGAAPLLGAVSVGCALQ